MRTKKFDEAMQETCASTRDGFWLLDLILTHALRFYGSVWQIPGVSSWWGVHDRGQTTGTDKTLHEEDRKRSESVYLSRHPGFFPHPVDSWSKLNTFNTQLSLHFISRQIHCLETFVLLSFIPKSWSKPWIGIFPVGACEAGEEELSQWLSFILTRKN